MEEKMYYRRKEIDVIEMKNNILQIRNMGKIYLLEFDSKEYIDKFYNILGLLNGKNHIDSIKKKIDLPEEETENIIKNLNNYQLLEEAGKNGENKVPEDYLQAFKNPFKVFGLAQPFIKKSDCTYKIYNYEVSVIGVNDLSKEIIIKLLEHGFRKISIINPGKEDDSFVNGILKEHTYYKDIKVYIVNKNKIENIQSPELKDFVIVPVTNLYTNDYFNKINELCAGYKKNWIPVYLDESNGHIGPAVVPGKTACFKCMELRLISNIENLEAYNSYISHIKENKKNNETLKSNLQIIAGNFIIDFYKLITNYKYAKTYNKVIDVGFFENSIKINNILKFPICPVCSKVAKKVPFDNYAYVGLMSKLKEDFIKA